MSENTSENRAKEEVQNNGSERPGNSLPLVLSGIAVLLAALALIANQMGQPEPRMDPLDAVNSKLGQIEARIGDMESQLTSDKLDVVNMQLKRILLDLEQLSAVADDATRQKIDQAYGLLKSLSGPAVRVQAEVDIQGTAMPENQTPTQEPATTIEEDTFPAEQLPTEATPAEPAPLDPLPALPEGESSGITEPITQSLETDSVETSPTEADPSSVTPPVKHESIEEAMQQMNGAVQGVSPSEGPAPKP